MKILLIWKRFGVKICHTYIFLAVVYQKDRSGDQLLEVVKGYSIFPFTINTLHAKFMREISQIYLF